MPKEIPTCDGIKKFFVSKYVEDTIFYEWEKAEYSRTFLKIAENNIDSVWMIEPNEIYFIKKELPLLLEGSNIIKEFKYFVMSNGIIKYVFERKKPKKNAFYLKYKLPE